MEIVTLVENRSSDTRLKEEFGLSLLVKCSAGKVLFDMGASGIFAENAAAMNERLDDVDCAVVSHAHYDHGGGLLTFLQMNSSARVYVGTMFDGQFYGNVGAKFPPFLQPLLFPLVKNSKSLSRYIGITREVFNYSDRLECVVESEEILEDVFLLSEIPLLTPLAEGNKFLMKLNGDDIEADDFIHEIIMVVRESDGLVLFTGCGHRHILNMLALVRKQFAGEPIKAVVGGFHLALRPGKPGLAGKREDVERIGATFLEAEVGRVVTGHCTGEEACTILADILADKYTALTTGLRCEL